MKNGGLERRDFNNQYMINPYELRLGNYILQKTDNKIRTVQCSYHHIDLLAKGDNSSLYPLLLKPELLEKCGFKENKGYPLLPDAREYILVLPVQGSNKNEVCAYIKNNKECFGRAVVNGSVASTNFYTMHSLQNIYFALTGEELVADLV